jgi:hypothetical protein
MQAVRNLFLAFGLMAITNKPMSYFKGPSLYTDHKDTNIYKYIQAYTEIINMVTVEMFEVILDILT